MKNLLIIVDEEYLDAAHAAFLIVYALHARLRNAASGMPEKGPGKQEYLTVDTTVGGIRLPVHAKPAVHVRLAKNQILGSWHKIVDSASRLAVDKIISASFQGLNARDKREFRRAFNKFKTKYSVLPYN